MPEWSMTRWLREQREKPEMPEVMQRPEEPRVEQTKGRGKTLDRDGRDREKQWRRSQRGNSGNESSVDNWVKVKVGTMGVESATRFKVQASDTKSCSECLQIII